MPAPVLITDTEISGLLKRVQTNFRENVQNLVTPLVAQLDRARAGGMRNVRWAGSGVFWDVVLGRPAGGTFSTGGFFPPDTTANERQANAGVVRAYFTRQIDGLAFVGTANKTVAFETIVNKTMQELRDGAALLMQRGMHNKANGVVAVVSASTSTLSFSATSPYGVASGGQGGLLLAVGDHIAIRDSVGTTLRGRATISAISHSGDTAGITTSTGIAGVAANDVIVHSSASDDSFNASMFGLIDITNRGGAYTTLHGLSAGDWGSAWDAVRMVAGTDTPDATQPTESDIVDLIMRVAGRSGKDAKLRPNEFILLTTPGLAKRLMESFVAQRRFDAGAFETEIRGGYKALKVCGLPLIEDYYVPAGTIYLIHKPSLAMLDAKDWGFVEFEGAGPWRWIQGRDAFETTYGFYGNLISLVRNAHGSITGYTDTARYTHI